MSSPKSGLVRVAVMVSFCWLGGCGSSANFNKIWGSDDKALDGLVAKAQMAYDRGEFDTALELAEEAYEINKASEKVAIMLGYIHLSKGGIDPFILARKLTALNSTATTTKLAAAADTSATSTLSKLTTLINMDADDYALLQTPYTGDSADSYFKSIPIFAPNPVTNELRDSVEVLREMNLAIKYVCGFVEPAVRVDDDPRDSQDNCPSSTLPRAQTYKAHFLWAFTHLTEALVFQSVLLYSDGTRDASGVALSNIERRSKMIDTSDFSKDGVAGISKFVAAVTDLKNSVDTIFTSNVADPASRSQLTATLNAMQSVTKAFAALPGMPKSVTAQITSAMDNIAKVSKDVAGVANTATQSSALKAQMTEKFSTTVASKIDATVCKQYDPTGAGDCSKVPADVKDQEQVKTLCTSYTSLANGLPDAKKTPPKVCS